MDTRHPVGKVGPVVAGVATQLPFPVRFRGPAGRSPACCRQPPDEPHPVFPAVGVVESGVEQPVPDSGSADVGTHPGKIGLWSRQLPAAGSGRGNRCLSCYDLITQQVAVASCELTLPYAEFNLGLFQ